jgi:replicative DNA helicase
MNKLVMAAQAAPYDSSDTLRPPETPHECFACYSFYDQLVADKKLERFPCSCKLSADIQLTEARTVSADLTDEEMVLLECALDPVAWAEFELAWVARWYQEELLKCSSLKKVVRAGRRAGKTETLAVDALHKIGTNSNYKVLIIAPYQAQVNLIFDRIDKFLETSLTLKNTIIRRVRSPSQFIQFQNGSQITGCTAGVKTGAKADKVRGQDANSIYLDEADLLAQGDLESILAIIGSHPDVTLWASGTPSGRREQFYRWCTRKELGVKQFHYPSSVSPTWTKEAEDWLRATYAASAYAQEFLAEFGEEAHGVFPKNLVDEQVFNYSLESRQPQKGFIYGLGVDWNDTTKGVHIVVSSWNPFDGKFWTERKVIVSRMEFTQTKAIEKIIELNAYWNPSFIYVDQGYGNTQVEILHQYGLKHPASGLRRKVKGIQMGSKVTMQDAFLGPVDKEVKPFIVNLCVRRVEQNEVVLPRSEMHGEGTEGLVDQMIAFRIKRFSPDGRPIYDQTPDHTLTAWMLAIYGFWMEHTDISKRKGSTRVAVLGSELPKEVAGLPFVRFELPPERAAEKKEEKTPLRPMPRGIPEPLGKTRTIGDVRTSKDRKAAQEKQFRAAPKLGFYSHTMKTPPRRKSF